MASGNTLIVLGPGNASFPSSGMATPDSRNIHPVLDFDTTSQETAYFDNLIMPRHYSGGGITVYVWAMMTSATSGTLGWDVSLERLGDSSTDLDADSFATAQTITATTVPGTSGVLIVLSVAITSGANMDSVAAGEAFRIRLRRDVANDTAAGDAEFFAMEVKET
jgi:hypothetical protein